MKRINKMSSLNTVTGLGLSLLISASSVLVQGCKDKPGVIEASKAKISYNLFTFDGEEKDLTGKDGSLNFSAIGNNGDFSRVYLGVNDVKGVLTVFDGTGVNHVDMIASDKADNADAADFNFKLGGGAGKDDAVITHIVAHPKSDKVAIGVRGLGRYVFDSPLHHKGGLLLVEGDVIRAGLRNHPKFFPGLDYNRDLINALITDENGWQVFFDNNGHASARGSWDALESVKLFDTKNAVITAAANANGIIYLATNEGNIIQSIESQKKAGIIIKTEDLDLVGLSNAITSLAVVGDRLLVGMKAFAGVAKSGGVYSYNLLTNETERFGLGQSVRSIAVAPAGNLALIATDKGMAAFADKKFASSNFSTVFAADEANANLPAFDSNDAPVAFAKGVIGFGFGPNNMVYAAIPGAPIQKIKITTIEKDEPVKDSTK